jgi:DNA-binding NarL/FixJ family response regulator
VADNGAIRVLIADASKMASELIALTLKRIRNPRFTVIIPSSFTSSAVIEEITRATPEVALLSNCLQDGAFAGFTVLRTLQAAKLSTRIVLLLEECTRTLVVDAFRAGARGIFSRSESTEHLAKCVSTVHGGQIWAGTHELNYVLEELATSRSRRIFDTAGRPLLSAREEDIVGLVADGLTNRQIAEHLKLSEHTVKNYLFNVFEKLGVSTRVELVLYTLSRNSARSAPIPSNPACISRPLSSTAASNVNSPKLPTQRA